MKEGHYIDDGELLAELERWRDSAPSPRDRTPSERLGQLMLTLHDHVLSNACFRGYSRDVKDEMKSYSLYRVFKRGLASFRFGTSKPFSYFTRAVIMNYITVARRYYRELNRRREWTKGQLARIDTRGDPALEEFINRFLGEGAE